MNIRERILDAAKHLAKDYPIDKITMGAVAQKAGVSLPTVRRYLGSKDQLQAFLASEQQSSPSVPLDTRSRILQAAKHVFAQEGYERATIDAIASAVGLTKGAVYWHFQSKSDLFLALLEEQIYSALAVTPEAAKQAFEHSNPQTGVAKVLARQLQRITSNPEWCRLYMEFMVQSRDPEIQKVLVNPECRDREVPILQMLRQLQAEGKLAADVDPFVIGVFWGALVDGLAIAHMVEPERIDLAAWSNQLARLLWRGIQPTSS